MLKFLKYRFAKPYYVVLKSIFAKLFAIYEIYFLYLPSYFYTVDVAQGLEHWIVVPGVVGSNPIFHPNQLRKQAFACFLFFNFAIQFTEMGKKENLEVVNNGIDTSEDSKYRKIETYEPAATEALKHSYYNVLAALGEDPEREGLLNTPLRVAKAMQFLTHGYSLNPEEIVKSAMFVEEYQQMVIVKDIEIYSLCEHHLLPFFGKAHVAYIPNGYITGLSKVARVVEAFSRRLQVQERLTTQIRNCLQETLNPLGVAVVIEAQHMCMQMRGIQKQNSVTTTSAFTGVFLTEPTRQEFIHLIGTKLH
jgi:GTP cyclohydrolase IA